VLLLLTSLLKVHAAAQQYVGGLHASAGGALCARCADGGWLARLSGGDGAARAEALHLLLAARGMMSATEPEAAEGMAPLYEPALSACAALVEAAVGCPELVAAIFKLCGEMAEVYITQMPSDATARMYGLLLQVLQVYAPRAAAGVAAAAAGADEEAAYRHVNGLLKLLNKIMDQALIASMHDGPSSEAVFLGMEVVVPMVGPQLLAYPKLRLRYYELLSFMVDQYPARSAALPAELFSAMCSALETGSQVHTYRC